MKITKFGHACVLVEEGGAVLLTDTGVWNTFPEVTVLDALLITHEHQDHCDIEQIRRLVAQHPQMRLITHKAVAAKLHDAGITSEILADGESLEINGVTVERCGTEHEPIYGASPCMNCGYLIAGELFVPGDALHDVPSKPVRILALPTGGPWLRLSETIEYAKRLKPKFVFPIHDAMYVDEYRNELVPRIVGGNLEASGITFVGLNAGDTKEF